MLIRYGCELSVIVDRPTPAFCLVDVHPDRRADLMRETPLRASPVLPLKTMNDAFGNVMKRTLLPPGETTLILDGVIADPGLPDARKAAARALPVMELPAEIAVFLNGSRYCETDKLGVVVRRSGNFFLVIIGVDAFLRRNFDRGRQIVDDSVPVSSYVVDGPGPELVDTLQPVSGREIGNSAA